MTSITLAARLAVALTVAAIIGACLSAGGQASPSPTPSPPVTASASPFGSSPATGTPGPTGSADDEGQQPPDGLLSAGGSAVAGWLGSFCWQSTCSDAPMLPDKRLLPLLGGGAGAGGLSFRLADGTAFYSLHASYSRAANGSPSTIADVGADYDPSSSATPPPELTEAQLDAPPSGDWALVATVRFSSGGDALFAWHVAIP